jgi:hypothetical protein
MPDVLSGCMSVCFTNLYKEAWLLIWNEVGYDVRLVMLYGRLPGAIWTWQMRLRQDYTSMISQGVAPCTEHALRGIIQFYC